MTDTKEVATNLKDVIEHLQIIRTWAELDGKMGRVMEPKCCLRVAEWVDEALDVLKERERRMMALELAYKKLSKRDKRHIDYTDWSGAQGNEGERFKEEAERGKWGIFG